MVVGSLCYSEFLIEETLMAKGKPKGPKFVRYFQPVIDVLKEKGGSATPQEVYEAIADQYDISEEDLSAQLKNGSSKFQNQVAWARFYLVKAGLVDSSKKGVWTLTPAGQRASLSHDEAYKIFKHIHSKWAGANRKPKKSKDKPVTEEDDATESDASGNDHREELMQTILDLPPAGFEKLCQRLLRESGFSSVTVTGKSGDGGIDGNGVLQVNPFVSFRVLFQSKKYKDTSVTASQVRDFRGAMMGRADKGIILSTGTFTRGAKAEATRDGVHPIELVDGEALIDLFEKLELGLKPKTAYDVDLPFFKEFME
jgi:restriction system protein